MARFGLTPLGAAHKISPESSDGFASVGTILPREEAALLPGGLFVFLHLLPNGPRSPVLYAWRARRYNPRRYVQWRRADVAQLVEQLIRNQQVIGSSPIVGSISVSFLAFAYRVWYRLSTVFFRDRLR